jgi:hypothetical protein
MGLRDEFTNHTRREVAAENAGVPALGPRLVSAPAGTAGALAFLVVASTLFCVAGEVSIAQTKRNMRHWSACAAGRVDAKGRSGVRGVDDRTYR